jgi:anti-sigma B factor antagonist
VTDPPICDFHRHIVDGVTIVQPRGEIDLQNIGALQREVHQAPTQSVILDLDAVTYLDSAGIKIIDHLLREAATDGRVMRLVARPDSIAAWTLKVAGFSAQHYASSIEAALTGQNDAGVRRG